MSAVLPTVEQPPAQRVMLVFEGGGAKGIVHVGAFAAVEAHDPKLDVRGAAGTSAGAIVAGLIAAGFTAPEIIDIKKSKTVLDSVGAGSMTGLFVSRWGAAPGWMAVRLIKHLGPLAFGALGVLIAVLAGLEFWLKLGGIFVVFAVSALLGMLAWLVLLWVKAGLCSTHAFIDAYDKALRMKVGDSATSRVTFKELYDTTKRSLKVVATCLDTSDVAIYGTTETPDVSVAEAVAASCCLPLIFAPTRVARSEPAGALHYDGGLVSNLPAWTLDEERLLDQDAVTIAFQITGPHQADPKGWSFSRWLIALVRAAVFGGAIIETRGTDRLISVPLRSEVRVLDFDMTWERAAQEFDNGFRAARQTVLFELTTRPDTLIGACRIVASQIEAAIVRNAGLPPGSVIVRAVLCEPYSKSARLLSLAYGWGVRDQSDEAMVLPIEGSLAGQAWKTGTDLFDAFPFAKPFNLPGAENRRRRSLVWSRVKWRVAIPIYDTPETGRPIIVAVLSIDGDGNAADAAKVITPAFANSLRSSMYRAYALVS